MIRRLKAWWAKARLYEPARLAAAWAALRNLALLLGFSIPTGLDGWVTGIGAAAAILLPLWQGERTRAAVDSPWTVLRKQEEALYTDRPA